MKTKIKLMALVGGLLSILPTTSVWADSHYYAQLKAQVATAWSGCGTVYAGTSTTVGEFGADSTSGTQDSTNSAGGEKTFYAFAKPEAYYEFDKWEPSGATVTATEKYGTDGSRATVTVAASSTDGGTATGTVTAYFKKKVLPEFCIAFKTSGSGIYTVDGVAPADKTGLTEVTKVTLATPDPNFLNWIVNGAVVNGNPYTASLAADTTISAEFLTADQVAEATTFDELTAALANDGKKKVIIPSGTEIVVVKGSTLNVPAGKQLVNEGTLFVEGALANSGVVSGSGKISKCARLFTQANKNGEWGPDAEPVLAWPSPKIVYWVTKMESDVGEVTGVSGILSHVTFRNGRGDYIRTAPASSVPLVLGCTVDDSIANNHVTAIPKTFASGVEAYNGGYSSGFKVITGAASYTAEGNNKFSHSWGTTDCAGNQVTLSNELGGGSAFKFLNGKVKVSGSIQATDCYFINCTSVMASSYHSDKTKVQHLRFFDTTGISINGSKMGKGGDGAAFYSGKFDDTLSGFAKCKVYAYKDENGEVYGGVFKNDPNDYLADPTGFEAKQRSSDDYWVVQEKKPPENIAVADGVEYEDLTEAIAKSSSGVITLTKHVEFDAPITIPAGKSITLELAGYNITGATGVFVNDGTLVINDGSHNDLPSTVSATSGKLFVNNGTMEITCGTYSGEVLLNAGNFITHGGTFNVALEAGEGVTDKAAVAEIRGGVFKTDSNVAAEVEVVDVATQHVGGFLDVGYVAVPYEGALWIGRDQYAIWREISLSDAEKAWRLTAIDPADQELYIRNPTTRETCKDDAEWKRFQEVTTWIKPYSTKVIDCELEFDRDIAAKSLTAVVSFLPQTLDEAIPANTLYSALIPRITQYQIAYSRFINDSDWNELDCGIKNNSLDNIGTTCNIYMYLCNQNRDKLIEGKWTYTYSNFRPIVKCTYKFTGNGAIYGSTDYESLAGALTEANYSGTVKLSKDCIEEIVVSKSGSFVLDRNNFAFTGAITSGEGYELTAKDLGGGKTQYDVAREAVAKIGEAKYASLGEAVVAAAESGETIDVVKESVLTVAEGVELTVESGKLVAAIPADNVLELKDGTDVTLTWPDGGSAMDHIIVTGGRYSADPTAFLAEGLEAKEVGDKWVVGVKIVSGDTETETTIVTTEKQESKVEKLEETEKAEVFKDVDADKVAEVVEKIEQTTRVEGVKLTVKDTEQKPAGIVAVVEEATKDATFAEAVKSAAEVSVKVEVEIKPTEYVAPSEQAQSNTGKVAFKLTPKATVTVKQDETELKQEVPVSNDMIDQNQKISVSVYTGFKPVVITHDDDKGARIETFKGDDQIDYNDQTGVATVKISHFSTLTSFGNAEDVPPAKVYVAQIGDVGYETLAAAFAAVEGGETVTLLANCALDANTSIPGKDVTITAVDPSISLTLKTGNYGGGEANVTFKNIKLIGVAQDSGTQYTTGLFGVRKETYENCTMIGPFCTYGAASFTGCVFKSVDYEGDENDLFNMPAPSPYTKMQSLWVYVGNCLVTVDQCKFLTYDRAVKIFGDESKTFNVRFTNTDFYCQKKNKAAIMVGVDHLKETNIIIDEKTVIAHPQYSDEVEGGYALVYSEYGELNGGTSEAAYLEAHPEATVKGQYAVGENIVLDESGKITAGTFSKLVGEKIIAEGFEGKPDLETGKIVVEETPVAVAKVGETEYATLAEAVAAVKAGWTVTLIADCDEAVTGGAVPFVLEKGGKNFTGSIAAATGFTTVASPIAGDDSIRYMPVDEEQIITAAMTKVASGFYQSGANYGASTGFYITSKAGLEFFRDVINNFNGEAAAYRDSAAGAGFDLSAHRFSGKTINLLADVDLNNETWTPIGRATDRDMLAGTFDGNNHVVSNLKTVYKTEGKDQAGFFGYSNKTFAIKNLTLRNVDITGFSYVGALISTGSKADSEIVNCHVVGSVSITAVGSYVGCIVGHGYCSVSSCSVEADEGTISVTGGGICVGGIYGYAASNPGDITDCSVSGLSISLAQNYVAGGIVGGVDRPLTVSRCSVEDVAIECQRGPYLGYVVGNIQGGDGTLAITDCTVANSTLLSHVDKYTEKEETYLVQCGAHDAPTCYYVGSNVETDGNGKVVGGTFEWLPDGLVAVGYEKVARGTMPETWVVQERPAPVVPIAEIVGKEGAYTSLDDAVQAAGADDVIRMLADADVGDVMGAYRSQKGYAYKLPGNLTIDLDNHEVKLSSVALHESDDGGKLLFEDGKININGAMGVAMEANDASSVFYVGKQGTLEFNSVEIVGTNVAASVIFRTYTKNAPLMRFDDCTISIDGCNDFAHTVQRVEFEDTQVQIMNNKGRVFRDNDGNTNDGGSSVTLLRSSVSVDGISSNGGEDVNAIVLDASSLSFKNYQTESMGANKCNIELKNGSSFVLDGVGSHGFTNGKLVVNPGCTVDVKNVDYLGLNVTGDSIFKAGSKVSVSNCCATAKTGKTAYYNQNIAMWSSGGSVVIENGADVKIDGRLIVKSGSIAIAGGRYKKVERESGTITLTGGIYTIEPDAAFVANGYAVVDNPDEATKETYPWKVQEKTVTTKDEKPIVIDIAEKPEAGEPDVKVQVTVTQELAKEILGAGVDVTEPLDADRVQAIVTQLETKGEDGMTGWQKYTAGFSQTDKHPLAPKGKGAEDGKLVLVTSLIMPKQMSVDTGVKVKYVLMQGSNVDSATGLPTKWDKVMELPTPEFPVDVTELAPETYWKIEVEYTATRTVETTVEPGN